MNSIRPFLFSAFFALTLVMPSAWSQTATPTPSTGLRLNGSGPSSGFSAFKAATTSGTTTTYPTIYASYTGPNGGCATPTAGSTCNSCGTSKNACSLTSIFPDLVLVIPLISGTAATFSGTPQIKFKVGSDTSLHAVDIPVTPAVNVGFSAQIKWSTICSNSGVTGANAACTADIGSTTISVGIDNNNDNTFEEKVDFNLVFRYVDGATASPGTLCVPPTAPATTTDGLCYFKVQPGDDKVYIATFAMADNALSTGATGVTFDRIVLFYEKAATAPALTSITPASEYRVLNVQNNSAANQPPGLDDWRMRDLPNGLTYCFMGASMDQTGIVSHFLDSTTLTAQKVCATPKNVVGLLDDKSCFIATATFGSPMAPEVVTFRKFRNEYLLTNAPGRAFVKTYYKYGPIGAEWIRQCPALKMMSLTLLWPLLMIVKFILALGMIPATLIFFLSAIAAVRLRARSRRIRARSH